jgi:acyl-CoA dehydrogenase
MSDHRLPRKGSDLHAFRQLARACYQTEVLPYIDEFAEQHHVDRELCNKTGELGLLCLLIPQAYSGGGTFAHKAVMIEEQSRIGIRHGALHSTA